MSRATMTWDGEADQQLLLSIIATHAIKVDYDAIAARVGPPCTPRAALERIKKLKKIAKERGFDTSSAATISTGTTTAAGSSKKRKIATPVKGAKKGGRATKSTHTETAGEEDELEGGVTVKAEQSEDVEVREEANGVEKPENGVKRDWDELAEDAANDGDEDAAYNGDDNAV